MGGRASTERSRLLHSRLKNTRDVVSSLYGILSRQAGEGVLFDGPDKEIIAQVERWQVRQGKYHFVRDLARQKHEADERIDTATKALRDIWMWREGEGFSWRKKTEMMGKVAREALKKIGEE